jgi:hypothetical protein
MLLNFIDRRHEIISEKLNRVFYIYGADQPEYHQFASSHPDVTFSPLFEEDMLQSNSLIIFDDFGQAISSHMNSLMTHLVTKCVNHSRVTIIIVLHHLYGKNLRIISLSQDYNAIFSYPRDLSILSTLSSQVFPGKGKFLRDAYQFAIRKAYSYLFLDLHVLQNSNLRVRTNIFNDPDCFLIVPG